MHTPSKKDLSMASDAAISLTNLGVTYASTGREVLHNINLEVQPEEFVTIVGHSGIGKSTLIRCIAGLQKPTTGTVSIAGKEISGPPSTLALVSQDYGRTLMPWLTIQQNVQLPLRGRGIPRAEQQERVYDALHKVGLIGQETSHPWQVSGGMQQRAAIARAIAYSPEVLLMDEPFASVDAQTRAELEDLILDLQKKLSISVLLVTHDVDEATYVSDKVIVIGGKPAGVQASIAIALGNNRSHITTKSMPEFIEYRNEIMAEITRIKMGV